MKIHDIQHSLSQGLGITPHQIEVVQPLWSGYGAIVRYWDATNTFPSIAKIINVHAIPEHPRGWAGKTSHQRKLSSFVNEQRFYHAYSIALSKIARVPRYLNAMATDELTILLLEDVDALGFAQRETQPDSKQLTDCLYWLARFHAFFLQAGVPGELWERGNYWHLATRQDELAQMEEGALKQHASALDAALGSAHYQTLLHGDAKIANFCFSEETCLALDFQYVGAGVGVVDVMYFLGSCLSEHQLIKQADNAFAVYFGALNAALSDEYLRLHWTELEREWWSMIPIAWADFERFLQGWSPSHHKLHGYSARQTQRGLALIK